MSTKTSRGRAFGPAWRWLLVLSLAVVATVTGCGGGVGVGGTGSFASGPITGFGSVIVNGIEFDDSSARVEDDDGAIQTASVLRLGMTVDVESGPVSGSGDSATAVADRIHYGSAIVGPVSLVDVASNTLTVFGQTVKVDGDTVFDDRLAGGLASVAVNDVVEVYGYVDAADGSFLATRIEPRAGTVAVFKVRGLVRQLDAAAHTFSIGGQTFSYDELAKARPAEVPAGLANGLFVRIKVQIQPVSGQWIVTAFGDALRHLPDLDRARLRGPITAFVSATSFSVNGQPVDASAASFPDGQAGLALGVSVDVEGSVAAGVLHATQVKLDNGGGAQGRFELKGNIESVGTLKTFVLRGVTVYYGGAKVEFDNGTPADIATGRSVEVRGVLFDGGTRLWATRIRFK